MTIKVEGLSKVFRGPRSGDGVVALEDVSLSVDDGEILAVVGPSGSGKTTLLRCIAGLEEPDSGRIEVAGRDVSDVATGRRNVAMVFQEYALYPHMTVAENISFGLRARGASGDQRRAATMRAADALGLTDVLSRRPGDLSGGQRQRVALARAIVREPDAFLMDEPLSNLDAELRTRTRSEIKRLQRDLGVATIYVTHDQVEAMTIGDRIVVMRDGRIQQVGSPLEVYERPRSAYVARFLGQPPMNLFSPDLLAGPPTGTAPVIGVRPERMRIAAPGGGRADGTVNVVETIGSEAIVHVMVGESVLLARVDASSAPAVDERVGIDFDDADVHRFSAADGDAL